MAYIIAPSLIAKYAEIFLQFLESKTNRMVWGAMIALSTIAGEVPKDIWPHRGKILELIKTGTVITNVAGVKTLINMSKAEDCFYNDLFEELFQLQKDCRDIDFAKRAEDMWPAIRPPHRDAFVKLLEERKPALSKAAQKRLEKVMKNIADG